MMILIKIDIKNQFYDHHLIHFHKQVERTCRVSYYGTKDWTWHIKFLGKI